VFEGRLHDVGRIGDLISGHVRAVELTAAVPPAAREALAGGRRVTEEGDLVTVSFEEEAGADAAVRAVVAAGGRVVSLTRHRETLEDFFVRRLAESRGAAASKGP